MSAGALGPLGAEITASLRDLNRFMREVGIYLVVIILASGGAFIFQNLIAADGWWSYADWSNWQTTGPVSDGRPVSALISLIARNAFPLHPFDSVLFYAALVVFAVTLFRRWSESSWVLLLLVALFVTSPFLVEPLLLGASQLPLAVALLLLSFWFLTLSSVDQSPTRQVRLAAVLAGSIAAALALATRSETIFLMLGATLIELARALLTDRGHFGNRVFPLFASLLLACAFAALLIATVVTVSGLGFTTSGNTGVAGLIAGRDDAVQALERFLVYWSTFLTRPHHLFPAAVKVLVLALAALAVTQCIVGRDVFRLAVIVIVAALLSALPLTLGLLSKGFPYAYASVFPLALFPCFLACVCVTGPARLPGVRWLAGIAGSAIVLVSAASLSEAQVRLANLNRRDFSTMTQFLAEIRAAGVADWKVAALGSYDDSLQDSWGRGRDQCSAFACAPSLAPIMALTLLEQAPASRVFTLTPDEQAQLKPALDALPTGSATLLRLDRARFVVLLK